MRYKIGAKLKKWTDNHSDISVMDNVIEFWPIPSINSLIEVKFNYASNEFNGRDSTHWVYRRIFYNLMERESLGFLWDAKILLKQENESSMYENLFLDCKMSPTYFFDDLERHMLSFQEGQNEWKAAYIGIPSYEGDFLFYRGNIYSFKKSIWNINSDKRILHVERYNGTINDLFSAT